MFITNPEKFAALFNEKYPGTYRQVNTQDVRDMTTYGLIGRYECYLKDDLEFIRGILQYEQMREKESVKPTPCDKKEPSTCKRCHQPLPIEAERKSGRPKEYCLQCEILRAAERSRKHRKNKKLKQKPATEKPLVYH